MTDPYTASAHPLSGRILVTGGAGSIGSALVWTLNQRGINDILIADCLGSSDKWRNLCPLAFSDYVEAPVLRARLLEHPDAYGDFSAVFHLGPLGGDATDVSGLVDTLCEANKELAGWALARGTRFIYASSADTYGNGTAGMDDRGAHLGDLRPLTPAAFSTHLFDLYASRAGWLDHIVGLKYFDIFGPNETRGGDATSLVHRAFEQISSTHRVALHKSHRSDFRDGEQTGDFLYVKDAAEMTLHFAETAPLATGLYNIGSGETSTCITVARAVFAALDRPVQIDFIDVPDTLRRAQRYYTRADISKLRATGYSRPITPLPEAVHECVAQYLMPDHRLGD